MRNELAPGTDQLGAVWAISAETGVTAWTYEQRAATMSLAATAGGLVFVGDVNGRFRALDDETGGSPPARVPCRPSPTMKVDLTVDQDGAFGRSIVLRWRNANERRACRRGSPRHWLRTPRVRR